MREPRQRVWELVHTLACPGTLRVKHLHLAGHNHNPTHLLGVAPRNTGRGLLPRRPDTLRGRKRDLKREGTWLWSHRDHRDRQGPPYAEIVVKRWQRSDIRR